MNEFRKKWERRTPWTGVLVFLVIASVTVTLFAVARISSTMDFNRQLVQSNGELREDIDTLANRNDQCAASYADARNDLNQHSELTEALAKVGAVPYDREANNCYDHTRQLMTALNDQGIASSIMINEDRSHAWIAVWVEAVTGEFIEPGNGFRILEVRDDNLQVVCDAYGSVAGRDVIK